MDSIPVIGAGLGCTVNTIVVTQLLAVVYEMVVVPGAGVAEIPLTTPPPTVTVAMAVLLLDHVPNGDGCVSVVVKPWQTELAPTIGAGAGLTVITVFALQPELSA